MECLQNRIDSFSKPVRVQNASKTGAAKNIKWPHPPSFIAKPLTLAEAGFYFDPSYEERDNVTCFVCGKELAGWEEQDDPFEIHWRKCAKTCPWAVVRCALKGDLDVSGRFAFNDKNRLPGSKLLEKARQQVYAVGDGWIHDQVRNHGANSKQMAKAGFLFTPQHPGDDSATCLYCNLSLNEWDSGDDPLGEHRKRKGTVCPFFIGSISPSSNTLTTSTTTKPTRSSSSSSSNKIQSSSRASTAATTRGRSRSVMPDIFEDTIEPLAPPAEAGSSKKSGNKKASSSSRSRSRKTITSIEEEPEDEYEQEEEEEPKKRPRASSRSLSRSVSRKRNASSSSRGKKTIQTVEEEEEETEEPITAAATSRSTTTNTVKKGSGSTRSRSRKSTKHTTIVRPAAEPVDEDEDDTDERGRERETERATLNKSTLSKGSKKSSKSSSRRSHKKKSTIISSPSIEDYATAPEEAPKGDGDNEDDEEDLPAVLVPKKKLSSRSVTKTRTTKTEKDAPLTEDEEVEERQMPVKSTASKTKKSTTTSTKKSTTTTRGKKPTTSVIADDDDNDDGGGDGSDQQTLGKSLTKAKKQKSKMAKRAVTTEEEVEEEAEEEKPIPAPAPAPPAVAKTKKSSKAKQKPSVTTTASPASIISATTSVGTIATEITGQDEERLEPEPIQQTKSKSKSHSDSAKVKSVVSKKESQSLRAPESEDEGEDEDMNAELVVVTKTTSHEKKLVVKAVEIEDDRDEATVEKSKKDGKKKWREDEDEEMRATEEIMSKPETKKRSVKRKKKQIEDEIDEDEDAEMQAVSATLKKPSLSAKSARPASKAFEEPLKRESIGRDEETVSTKGKSKQVESTTSQVVLAEEQTSKPSVPPPSNRWPFNTVTAITTTAMKRDEPTQPMSSDYSDSDVEMEDATIVRKMMKMKKSISTERLQLPSPPPYLPPTLPSPPPQSQSQPSYEQEKPTNSEDEVQADLEDVELDDVNDTGMGNHTIQQQEILREQHGDHDGRIIDDEAISFAPRLVTKSSEVQQQQRPRTPNLVPFQAAGGSSSVVAGSGLSSVSGLDLGGEKEKIPKTPPRKFVFEGVAVPPVPSAKTSTIVDKDQEIDTDDAGSNTKSSTTQSGAEQTEIRHRQTPPQESEKSKTSQAQFTPFLSKLPFVPLHVLSDAELDMTVEEWIRYQMEVEYDKFKRDGERELARFRKNAEETRKVIEGL